MLWCRPGASPKVGQARSKVKAGLKVSRGLTSEASARARAKVERRVAAQLKRAEASRAATKRPSMRGIDAAHESERLPCRGVIEHWVSRRVPAPRIGREAALMIQATSAGRLSRSRRLFRMGRKEVRMVAMSARRAAMMSPSYCKKDMITSQSITSGKSAPTGAIHGVRAKTGWVALKLSTWVRAPVQA